MIHLQDIERIQALADSQNEIFRAELLGEVDARGELLPIYGFVLGTEDRSAPTYGIFGGFHGLESVGVRLALYFLKSLLVRSKWDTEFQERLQECRLVSIPLINPGGLLLSTRSNPQGVDLMRNSPVSALDRPTFMVGGHRISSRLPWYRGRASQGLAYENRCFESFVRQEIFASTAAITIDLHSGFGMRDRLWYPYAKQRAPFPLTKQAENLHRILNEAHPYNVYRVEPQSSQYITHGDMWDYLFDAHRREQRPGVFLPLTLEMGSWLWVRKNPAQLFSSRGPFNPIKPHRYQRVMRRHWYLLDFLFRATLNHHAWT